MAYSVDLRKRIVNAVLERRMTIAEAAKTFQTGTATVERYLRRYREKQDLAPRTSPGRPSGLAEREALLQQHLEGTTCGSKAVAERGKRLRACE